MDIQAKLDSIQEQKQSLLNLTPTQHKSKNLSKLYAQVVDARETQHNAPFRVKEAEKQYYVIRDGEDGYAQHMAAQYTKEARSVRQSMLSAHLAQLSDMNTSLTYYDSVRIYLKNISKVQLTSLNQIKELLNKIRMSEVNTNHRKSYYMEQEQKNISIWIMVCNCFIFSYTVLLSYNYRDKLKNPLVLGVLVFLLSVTFLLSYLINFISKVPTAINVYTEWGYDPTESKIGWYFYIPLGFVALWYTVKYFT